MILENCNLKNTDLIEVRISDNEKINVNDEIIVSLFIKNKSPYILRNVKIYLEEPYMFGLLENRINTVRIEVNQEVEIKYHFFAVIGGRDFLKFKLRVTELFDLNLQEFKTIVFVDGVGLYRGDNHSHSTRSDGQNNNSVLDNAKRVRETRALSWLTPTDHMHINTEDCEEINKLYDDFICIPNCGEYGQIGKTIVKGEYPNGKIGEHALQFNVKHVNTRMVDGRKWQDVIDEVNEQGGIFYIAHPLYPTIWWDYDEAFNAQNIAGLEVWQGDYHALDEANRRSFDLWDAMNSVGKKVNGLATSDGHFLHRIGHPFIMANLDSLSVDNVLNVLRSGRFYGSNGVFIRFMINGAENNEVAYLKEGEKAIFKLYIYDESSILNIKIFKNKISSTPNHSIVFKEYNFQKEINEFIEEFSEFVEEDEFYRVEVTTKVASIGPGAFLGNYYGLGFGYTNPIYIKYKDVDYLNEYDKDVKYTKSGYMYYVRDGKFVKCGGE